MVPVGTDNRISGASGGGRGDSLKNRQDEAEPRVRRLRDGASEPGVSGHRRTWRPPGSTGHWLIRVRRFFSSTGECASQWEPCPPKPSRLACPAPFVQREVAIVDFKAQRGHGGRVDPAAAPAPDRIGVPATGQSFIGSLVAKELTL